RGSRRDHGPRAGGRSDQPRDLSPRQAVSRRADAGEDGSWDHGSRPRGARAISRFSPRGAGLLDAVVTEAQRLGNEARAETGPSWTPAQPNPGAAQARLRSAGSSLAARSAAAAAGGDPRRRAPSCGRALRRRARAPPGVRAPRRPPRSPTCPLVPAHLRAVAGRLPTRPAMGLAGGPPAARTGRGAA